MIINAILLKIKNNTRKKIIVIVLRRVKADILLILKEK